MFFRIVRIASTATSLVLGLTACSSMLVSSGNTIAGPSNSELLGGNTTQIFSVRQKGAYPTVCITLVNIENSTVTITGQGKFGEKQLGVIGPHSSIAFCDSLNSVNMSCQVDAYCNVQWRVDKLD